LGEGVEPHQREESVKCLMFEKEKIKREVSTVPGTRMHQRTRNRLVAWTTKGWGKGGRAHPREALLPTERSLSVRSSGKRNRCWVVKEKEKATIGGSPTSRANGVNYVSFLKYGLSGQEKKKKKLRIGPRGPTAIGDAPLGNLARPIAT